MGLDLFLQSFRAGGSCEAPTARVRALLEDVTESAELGFVRIRVGSAEADVYADLDGQTLTSITVSRPESGTEGFILELAKTANAVIMIPAGPTLLINEAQRRELPDELAGAARLVESGDDLAAAIRQA